MDFLERDVLARLSVATFENLYRKGSQCQNAASSSEPWLWGDTHRRVGSLSQLLQLLERGEMAFAVHLGCGSDERCVTGFAFDAGRGSRSRLRPGGEIWGEEDASSGDRLAQQVQ